MKIKSIKSNLMTAVLLLLFSEAVLSGCNNLEFEKPITVSEVSFSINPDSINNYLDDAATKNMLLTLDTNKFLLKFYSTEGYKIYDGKYIDRPASFKIEKGTYNVELLSFNFTKPQFDAPLIGEKKTIIVGDSLKMHIEFNCRQLNSGIRLIFNKDFLLKFLGNKINIIQGKYSEIYKTSEKRFLYLNPSEFEIKTTLNNEDTTLLKKTLLKAQMLTIELSYIDLTNKSAYMSYYIDSSRYWVNSTINLNTKLPSECITISQISRYVGQKNIYVFGYIFGGDPTENTIKIAPPFGSMTTLVIAPSMKERQIANCITVELPIGDIRDNLNLAKNRALLGSPIVVYGNIVDNYFGRIGIKSTKRYILPHK